MHTGTLGDMMLRVGHHKQAFAPFVPLFIEEVERQGGKVHKVDVDKLSAVLHKVNDRHGYNEVHHRVERIAAKIRYDSQRK